MARNVLHLHWELKLHVQYVINVVKLTNLNYNTKRTQTNRRITLCGLSGKNAHV